MWDEFDSKNITHKNILFSTLRFTNQNPLFKHIETYCLNIHFATILLYIVIMMCKFVGSTYTNILARHRVFNVVYNHVYDIYPLTINIYVFYHTSIYENYGHELECHKWVDFFGHTFFIIKWKMLTLNQPNLPDL